MQRQGAVAFALVANDDEHDEDEDDSEDSDSKRLSRSPCPKWWRVKARAAMRAKKAQGITAEQIAAAISDDQQAISKFMVSRTINNKNPTLVVIERLSTYLGIPAPVTVAWSEDDVPVDDSAPRDQDTVETKMRKNLVRFRREAGYDQAMAAYSVGLPVDQYVRFERGEENVPTGTLLAQLAQLFGREPGHFYNAKNEPLDRSKLPKVRVLIDPTVDEGTRERVQLFVRDINAQFRADQNAGVDHVLKATKALKEKAKK